MSPILLVFGHKSTKTSYTPSLRTRLLLAAFCVLIEAPTAHAQFYVTGLGGFAALSNGAAAQASPPSTSSFDPKVGAAFNLTAGRHFNDWISAQAGYIGNRNQITVSELAGGGPLVQRTSEVTQHAIGVDAQLYFRPRQSWVRPYLAAGPYWLRIGSENKLGFRVAVGADLVHRKSGWGLRYTFSEMMSPNAIGRPLHPKVTGVLMNFQNLFGIVKQF